MILTLLPGYPDFVGKRQIFAGYGPGPTTTAAGGDPVSMTRYATYVDIIFGAYSVSRNFQALPAPSAAGPRALWNLFYAFATSGSVASVAQSAAGSGMTPGTYTVAATGGGGTGAQAVVVVSSATTISSITVINPGSGYTSAPTFSLAAAGGTPATLTATLSTAGQPVAPGANLSGETFQLGGFCGQY